MTTTPELDRAIGVALEAHKMSPAALNDQMRGFVRNIVAELFTNLEPPEGATCYEVDLFNDAKRAVLKAAGLEDLV
ncbi:MAG: hypothetical protein ACK5X3_20840 [Pseudomonadota bacterium]